MTDPVTPMSMDGEDPTHLARFVAETAQERQASSRHTEELILPEDLLPGARGGARVAP